MGIITLSQSGIEFTITVPHGEIKIDNPNGGTLELDEPVRIISIKESEPETVETGVATIEETIDSETTEELTPCEGDSDDCNTSS